MLTAMGGMPRLARISLVLSWVTPMWLHTWGGEEERGREEGEEERGEGGGEEEAAHLGLDVAPQLLAAQGALELRRQQVPELRLQLPLGGGGV